MFDQLQAVLLDELGTAGGIDLERVSVDSFSLRAVKGGTSAPAGHPPATQLGRRRWRSRKRRTLNRLPQAVLWHHRRLRLRLSS